MNDVAVSVGHDATPAAFSNASEGGKFAQQAQGLGDIPSDVQTGTRSLTFAMRDFSLQFGVCGRMVNQHPHLLSSRSNDRSISSADTNFTFPLKTSSRRR